MTSGFQWFAYYSPALMWSCLVFLFALFTSCPAEPDADPSSEISFSDTRGDEEFDDVVDPRLRKLEVVQENPVPGMIPIRVRRAAEPLINTYDEQVDTTTAAQRVKRKTGGKKALKNKKTKLNKGTASNP
ncbi:hypothetical protein GCK32_017996 [Trichostrongylus colubriformis]|uniref:Secreted protein n=1 Tax=Trichostrongylus colubriformis TaxID=6319 RepID=A0AAN8FQS5_TRICO